MHAYVCDGARIAYARQRADVSQLFLNCTGIRGKTIIFFVCGKEYGVDTYMGDGGLASVVCYIIRYNCSLREWHKEPRRVTNPSPSRHIGWSFGSLYD